MKKEEEEKKRETQWSDVDRMRVDYKPPVLYLSTSRSSMFSTTRGVKCWEKEREREREKIAHPNGVFYRIRNNRREQEREKEREVM